MTAAARVPATAIPQTPKAFAADEDRILAAAHDLGDDLVQSDFLVPDMHCAGCLRKVEKGLQALDFVASARANLSTRRVCVTWRKTEGRGATLGATLTDLGFENTVFDLSDLGGGRGDRTTRRLALSVGVAGFGAANIMLLSVSVWSGADAATRDLFHLLSGLIAVPVVAFAGRPFFASALKALSARRLNMDVPISLAVLLALAISLYESLTGGPHAYFDAAVMLLFFLLIGRTLDHMMREKARGAVARLSRMASRGAIVLQDGDAPRYAALGEIEPGMNILVRAGERIPVDGVVQKGASDLDRSLVTGESAPVTIGAGDPVEAGILNLTGPLEIRTTKDAAGSFLAEMVSMMEAAEQGKAVFSRIADRAAALYAPVVHLAALATFAGWMTIANSDWHTALFAAISVLIITCPCALGLAVPIVHVLAANRLMQHGIMIKDGAALEKLATADMVVFDKTGTLTTGTPHVTSVSGPVDDATARLAGALANRSGHPSARAVAAHFAACGEYPAALTDIREVPGSGIQAMADGKPVRLGRRAWVLKICGEAGTDPALAQADVAFAQHCGGVLGFALEDSLRPNARPAVDALRAAGLDLKILSGDNERAVRACAEALGIEDFSAGQTPADKIAAVDGLQACGRLVLMVGDGINDAPALAAGHVSMAPSTGSDVGRLASDLVFMNPRLDVIPFARTIALRADRLVKQNFALAVLYNCIAIPLAVLGHATPLVAAIAMSGSSVVVIANSMRLYLGTHFGAEGAAVDRPAPGADAAGPASADPASHPFPARGENVRAC